MENNMTLEQALAKIKELEKRIEKIEEDIKDLYGDTALMMTEDELYRAQVRDHMWK